MNKTYIITLSILIALIFSCKKGEDLYPSKVVDVTYPTIRLNGNELISMDLGGTYTELGAMGYDDVTKDSVPLTGDASEVDPSREGLYLVKYSMYNSHGYKSTVTRVISITGISNDFDISGSYFHATRGGTANVEKIAKGVFLSDNVNGARTSLGSLLFMVKADLSLVIPSQTDYNGVELNFLSPALTLSPDTSYVYSISGSGYGTAPRLFVKE